MTDPIDTPRHPVRTADTRRHASASRRPARLDQDDIVRPELRNDAILAALPGQAALRRRREGRVIPPARG